MTDADDLQTLPGIGPRIARALRDELGVQSVSALGTRDPERLYAALNRVRGVRQDPCVLYTFRCAVYAAPHREAETSVTQMVELEGQTSMMKEFIDFLKLYGVIGLAIAVIIGGKANALVTALVDGIFMPIVTFFIPNGDWRNATLFMGPIQLKPGPVLGAAVDFLIVAFLVFWLSKKVLKEEKIVKK